MGMEADYNWDIQNDFRTWCLEEHGLYAGDLDTEEREYYWDLFWSKEERL